MDEVTVAAASVAAEPVTAPAPESTPASAPATPPSAAPSGNSQNLDAKADYLTRIRNVPLPSDPAEAAVAEAMAKAEADNATDAPVSGESDIQQAAVPAEGDQQTQAAEPAKALVIPYDELPANMRGELKRANLAPEVKEALAQAWYERKAFHDTGFTVDHARQLKTFGVTPEAAVERIKLHPTVADAQTDAQLADIARNLINDYQSNPQAMIDGLRSNAPQAFGGFAKTFATQLRSAAPDVFSEMASDIMWTAISIAERELPEDALDEREHVAYIKAKFFPNQNEGNRGQTSAFNPNDPIHKEYQRLVQNQQEQRVAQATQFESALYQYGAEAVKNEVAERFRAAAPAGLPDEFVERAIGDIMASVSNDVINNKNVRDQVTRFLSGTLTQEDLNAAVAFVTDRARPLIAVHLKPHLDFWSKAARPATPSSPAIAPKPAPKPAPVQQSASVQRVPGSAPAATPPSAPPADFLKAARSKGWDNLRVMQEWSRARMG